MNIGLYFGTFNPIHIGHLIISNHMVEFTDLDEVWLVVSPQNPFKKKNSLLQDYHRLAMVRIAVEENAHLKASDIEFKLPTPSYTVTTLAHISEKHPQHTFSLIMGEDNLRTFNKWKNFEYILEHHKIFVYPRALTEQERDEMQEEIGSITTDEFSAHPKIELCDAPVMKVSASFIRKSIKDKKDVRYLLTNSVRKYVDEMNFYK